MILRRKIGGKGEHLDLILFCCYLRRRYRCMILRRKIGGKGEHLDLILFCCYLRMQLIGNRLDALCHLVGVHGTFLITCSVERENPYFLQGGLFSIFIILFPHVLFDFHYLTSLPPRFWFHYYSSQNIASFSSRERNKTTVTEPPFPKNKFLTIGFYSLKKHRSLIH